MLFRFCLYGFLKNLRLFDAFLILALLERDLGFAAIGGLIAVREVMVNLLEVPSGALADGLGRKRCMVVSMAAYGASFPVLATSSSWTVLALGMALFGVGDAFRSGTHKAMIWTWLRGQGREAARTQIYGYTRSWSQIGSAVSALLGLAVIWIGGSYSWVFWASCLPTLINLVNLATYPAYLDRDPSAPPASWAATLTSLRQGLRQAATRADLRRLLAGSMSMEGLYGAVKGYLQPLLQQGVIAVPLAVGLATEQRTAVLVAIASTILFLLTAYASRIAHRVERACGGEVAATRVLAWSTGLGWAAIGPLLYMGWWWAAALVLIGQGMLQNLWRPIQISRYDACGEEHLAATTLSIESQLCSLTTAIAAPLLGWAVDLQLGNGTPGSDLWPIALIAVPILALAVRR
jgi:MFS family permease